MVLNKRFFKFAGGFLAIILLGFAVWYATLYFSPEAKERREALQAVQELEEEYRNDTYGGETPEETQ